MRKFKNWIFPEFKHGIPTKFGWTVYYPENFILGKYTDLGWGTFINSQYGVEICDHTQIGPFCSILSGNTINDKYERIIIGKNVKIGSYTLVLPGSIIKDDTYIKAKSIVYEKRGITYVKEVLDCCGIRRIDR